MTHRNSLHRRASSNAVQRRTFLSSLAGGGVALAAALRSERVSGHPVLVQAPATPAADALDVPVGQTFVGPTADPETLVAIVLRDDEPGEAVACLCRGPELNVWFGGTV